MRIKRINLPAYLILFLFFCCTDIYIVSGIKLVYLFAFVLAIKLLRTPVLLGKKDYFLFLWLLSYFFAVGHIISTSDFFAVLLGQGILVVIYLYFKSIRQLDLINLCDYWFQVCLYVNVFIGLIQVLLFYAIGSTWGISHTTHGVGLPRMSGLCSEPDWYGVICMMAFIYMITNILTKKTIFGKKVDFTICITSALMLVMCLTRAAWVGCAAAFVVFLLLSKSKKNEVPRRKLFRYIRTALPLVLVLAVGLFFTKSSIFLKLLQRLDVFHWGTNDGGAFNTRKYSIEIMLHYFSKHPFTGNGVGGMAAIASDTALLNRLGYFGEINAGRGNANVFITNLFDVGVFGTFFFCVFMLMYLIQSIRCFKQTNDYKQMIYIMLFVALIVDFQFNNGIRQPYVWLLLGLSSAVNSIEHHKGRIVNENRN